MEKQSYWENGGKIGIVFAFCFFILGLLGTPIFSFLLFSVLAPLIKITHPLGSFWNIIVPLIIILVLSFVTGALIGWVYGKIKNSSLKTNTQ